MSWGLGFALVMKLGGSGFSLVTRGLFRSGMGVRVLLGGVGVVGRLLVGLFAVVIAVFVLTLHINAELLFFYFAQT